LEQEALQAPSFRHLGFLQGLFQGLLCFEEKDSFPLASPIKFENPWKARRVFTAILVPLVHVGRQAVKGIGSWKRGAHFLKQPGLAHLAWKIKPHIIVGKDLRAVLSAHPVKGFATPLGK
jgi:hypothetical protein